MPPTQQLDSGAPLRVCFSHPLYKYPLWRINKTMPAPVPPTCTTCMRASDNAATNCPARMSDGRLFTDYRPRCDQIADLMPAAATDKSGINSYEFRMHLTAQAEEVMRRNMMWAYEAAACGPCDHAQPGTMLPEQALQRCDASACTFEPSGHTGGLGLGRDYGSYKPVTGQDTGLSAARDAFLRKQAVEQQRLAREPNACIVASDKLGWAPIF